MLRQKIWRFRSTANETLRGESITRYSEVEIDGDATQVSMDQLNDYLPKPIARSQGTKSESNMFLHSQHDQILKKAFDQAI